MSEPTTVSLPATKSKCYGRDGGVSVSIGGVTVHGYGQTLAEAKQSAVDALLELATVQQSGTAATVFDCGDGSRILTVYYPEGSGTGSINISIGADGALRKSSAASMHGTPEENAVRAAVQADVTRI